MLHCTRSMFKMNVWIEKIEKYHVRDSKDIEKLNSRLDKIEAELREEKEELTRNIRNEVANAVSSKMRKVRAKLNTSIGEGFDKMVKFIVDREFFVNIDSPKITQPPPGLVDTSYN